jgi:hypothetical protein
MYHVHSYCAPRGSAEGDIRSDDCHGQTEMRIARNRSTEIKLHSVPRKTGRQANEKRESKPSTYNQGKKQIRKKEKKVKQ